ncbi:MAG: hypothetical protein HC898_01480 [Phycisphaerales bacterium]|nr:hypothetical protein [Phycisphaerales bacterium]
MADMPVIEVRHVRIRSWLAQVDVIRPADPRNPAGLQQLVSVHLKYSWGLGWSVDRLHLWRIPLEDALFQARYSEIDAAPINAVPRANRYAALRCPPLQHQPARCASCGDGQAIRPKCMQGKTPRPHLRCVAKRQTH